MRAMQTPQITHWLLYCRPGFEQDCAQEALREARRQRPVIAEQPPVVADSGHVVVALNGQRLSYRELIFARQLIRLHRTIERLPERDRLTPILDAVADLPGPFGVLWLEVPDTNDGKALSAFTRRFQPLLEAALRERGLLRDEFRNSVRAEPDEATSHSTRPSKYNGQVAGYESVEGQTGAGASTGSVRTGHLPRLHIFFPDRSAALIGASNPHNSAPWPMGILRQSMPAEAPSRSTLKLAEAIEAFMDRGEQARLLRSGMTAVDLGAAPGGWTWQLVKRGLRVTAVDNGPMKGVLAHHPLVQHLRQDGFKYKPRKAVDWLVCDMVEKPSRVAALVGEWFAAGLARHAIFNLKLPMKQRLAALDAALNGIRAQLDEEGINCRMRAKQLYHDREEVTVFLTRPKHNIQAPANP